MREDLNARAERRMAVLDPVKLVIDNYPAGEEESCFAPNHPQRPEQGKRALPFSRELWIERDDYQEDAPQGYFRLAPGAEVRLRFAYIVRCVGAEKDADGNRCRRSLHVRSRDPLRHVRAPMRARCAATFHWLSAAHAVPGASAALRSALSRRRFPA
jgi:glutaminyl-tRNA synthetase